MKCGSSTHTFLHVCLDAETDYSHCDSILLAFYKLTTIEMYKHLGIILGYNTESMKLIGWLFYCF